jgi:hypothetical protein
MKADWDAFAAADRVLCTPGHVDDAVMAAWDDAHAAAAPRVRHWWQGPFVPVAAAAVVLIACAVVWLAMGREEPAGRTEPILTLSADPLFATESLHIVRVRMPRGALRALGVALVEPEANGLVDVDVVVGDDGLPREIRRVTAVMEGMEERVR